jgi:hypothetical protein
MTRTVELGTSVLPRATRRNIPGEGIIHPASCLKRKHFNLRGAGFEWALPNIPSNFSQFLQIISSSDQSFWLHIQRSQVRFPNFLQFLSSSGSGTRFTPNREEK